MSFDALKVLFQQPKSKLISVITSNKNFTSEHIQRIRFVKKLKEHYGDTLDFYGRGFATMDDKLESLQDYRFQIVLENSCYDHYFSEKLTDCILAGTYPLYYGCPNLDSYFPNNSYRSIDINHFDSAVATIDAAIAQDIDKQYRTELLQARDRVLYEHNLFPMLIQMIGRIERGEFGQSAAVARYGDKMLPFRHDKFATLFGPKVKIPFHSGLSSLANSNWLFNLLRTIYRKLLYIRDR